MQFFQIRNIQAKKQMEERLDEFINKYSIENIHNKSSDAAISFVSHQVNIYPISISFFIFFILSCICINHLTFGCFDYPDTRFQIHRF